MKKKLFLILILPALALVGVWFLRGVFATSNPHSWDNGLVGYWSFDGQYVTSTDGVKDASNNGNYGQFRNGVKPAPGISGQALSFDGVDDYVSMGNVLNMTGSQTIEAWIYLKSYGADRRSIYAKNSQSWLRVEESPGNLIFYLYQGAAWKVISATENISLNTWYHVVATYDNIAAKVYINGVDKSGSSTIIAGGVDSSVGGSYIGEGAVNSTWDGLIDEVRIYDRALSAEEVKQHYEQTKRDFITNSSVPSNWWTSGLVGYWNFDGQNTTSTNGTRDASGNNNWGTFSGGVKPVGGISGQGLSFDGVDDYVSTPLDMAPTAFTLEAWIKSPFTASTDDIRGIITKRTGSHEWQFYSNPSTKKIAFGYTDAAAAWQPALINNTALVSNTWYHVVLTYNQVTNLRTFYLNGSPDGNLDTGNATRDTAATITLGENILDVDRYWDGFLDEVRIYNRALSADEVKQHYEQTRRNFVVNSSVPSSWWTSGLVGYWNFDGRNTTSTNGTRDTSGYNNWGVFNGGVKPTGGISGQALSFDGVDDYVEIPENITLATTPVTLEAWVKPNTDGVDTATSQPIISSDFVLLFIRTSTNSVQVRYDKSGVSAYTSQYILGAGFREWVHIVGTFDGNNSTVLYINGVLKDSDTHANSADLNYNTLIGYSPFGAGSFNGLIDEVRIYDRALSADEVKQHYEQTRRNLGI